MHNVKFMMYTGTQAPWWLNASTAHLAAHADEPVTSKDAMRLSGLDKFKVEKRQGGFYSESRKSWIEVPEEMFLVHTQTGTVTGRCKDGYQEYQPSEGFEYLDRFVAEGSLAYHTAGILDEYKKVWLLAQTPSRYSITRRSGRTEEHVQFLMSSLDFTGAGSNVLCPTSVRVVCANTERMARNGAPIIVRIQHKGDMEAKYEAVRDVFAHMFEDAEKKRIEDQLLANALMKRDEMIETATGIFLDKETKEEVDEWFAKATDRSQTILKNKVFGVARLFDRGIAAEGDSAYDLLQAFTQVVDHADIGKVRNKVEAGKKAAKAVTSAFDGSGAEIKVRARQRLLRKIGA